MATAGDHTKTAADLVSTSDASTGDAIAFPATNEARHEITTPPPNRRLKRFSLNALKHPLLRAARDSPATRSKAVGEAAKETAEVSSLKDKTLDMQATKVPIPASALKKKQTAAAVAAAKKVARRISFSPSTEDPPSVIAVTSTANGGRRTTKLFGLKRPTPPSPPKRRASLDEGSLGRARGRKLQQQGRPARRRSLSISSSGIRIATKRSSSPSSNDSSDAKSEASSPRVARQQAVAARHARVLERIINAGSSVELEELKAKRIKKLGAPKAGHKAVVQQYPVVAPRKVKALKEALTDNDQANGIIAELRNMEFDEPNKQPSAPETEVSEAQAALLDLAESDGERRRQLKEQRAKRRTEIQAHKARPAPLRAVCLDCTDAEILRLRSTAKPVELRDAQQPPDSPITAEEVAEIAQVAVAVAESGILTVAISKLGTWLRITPAEPKSTPREGAVTATVVEETAPTSTSKEEAHTALGNTVQYTLELGDDIRTGDVQEAVADAARLGASGLRIAQPLAGAVVEEIEAQLLPENKVLGQSDDGAKVPVQVDVKAVSLKEAAQITSADANAEHVDVSILSGVSPISLLTSPSTTLGLLGAQKAGAFDAIASVTGAAIAYSQGGVEGMQGVQPPLDRMAIFVHWWGFELTLPETSMQYLGTASSVSSAFLGFLQTMVTTGGVPELLPFIRYISSFMDMEFSAIKSQDKDGRGVIVAATWLMPLALVPRPWDYGFDDGSQKATPSPSPLSDPQPNIPVDKTPPPSLSPTAAVQSHPLPSLPPSAAPLIPARFSVVGQTDSLVVQSPAIPLSETRLPHTARRDIQIHSHPPVAGAAHSSADYVLDSVQEVSEGGSVRIK